MVEPEEEADQLFPKLLRVSCGKSKDTEKTADTHQENHWLGISNKQN